MSLFDLRENSEEEDDSQDKVYSDSPGNLTPGSDLDSYGFLFDAGSGYASLGNIPPIDPSVVDSAMSLLDRGGVLANQGDTAASDGFSFDKYSLYLPDGTRTRAPTGMPVEEAYSFARQQFPDAFEGFEDGEDSSPFDAFLSSASRQFSGIPSVLKVAIAEATNNEELFQEGQSEMIEASAYAAKIAPDLESWEDVKDTYEKEGLAPAIGNFIEWGVENVAQSVGFLAPTIAGSLGGYALGSTIFLNPIVGAGTLGLAAGLGTIWTQFLSGNSERAYQEGAINLEEHDLLKMMAAATGQTALNSLTYLTLGSGSAVKGLATAGFTPGAKKVAFESLGKLLGKLDKMHPVKQAAAVLLEEEVAEVGQQALERYAAGLPVSPMNEQAADEYALTMLAVIFPGLGFGAARAGSNAFRRSAELDQETALAKVKALSGEAGKIAQGNIEVVKRDSEQSLQDLSAAIEEENKQIIDSDIEAEREIDKIFKEELRIARSDLNAQARAAESADSRTRADSKRIDRQAQIQAREAAKRRLEAEGRATDRLDRLVNISNEDIENTARSRNILFDNNPAFMSWMYQVRGIDGNPIGKYEIDALTQEERRYVLGALEGLPVQPRESSFAGASAKEAERVFRESIEGKNPSSPVKLSKALKIPRRVPAEVRDGIAQNYYTKMKEMGLVSERNGRFYVNSDLNPALEEQYQKVAPLISNGKFPSYEEVVQNTDIRDPEVYEELRLASIARSDAKYRPETVTDRQYRLSVDGQIDDTKTYRTIEEAQEAADSVYAADARDFDSFEQERRIPSAYQREIADRRIQIVEEPAGFDQVSEVQYQVSKRPTGAWEVVDAEGNRVALRASKKKAQGFVDGTGAGRVDIYVNDDKIGSARTRPEAQKRRDSWFKQQYQAEYDRAYQEAMATGTVPNYRVSEKTRQSLLDKQAKAQAKKAADALNNTYKTRFEFVPNNLSVRKAEGYTVTERRIGTDKKRTESKITDVFPSAEAADQYVSSSLAEARGDRFYEGKPVTSEAKLRQIDVARRDPEASLARRLRGIPEETPTPVREFDPSVVPDDIAELRRVRDLTKEERLAEAKRIAFDRTLERTGGVAPVVEGPRVSSEWRAARIGDRGERSVIKRLDDIAAGIESGEIQFDPESEIAKKWEKQKLTQEQKAVLTEEIRNAPERDRAEWIVDLERIFRSVSSRMGLPLRVNLYQKSPGQESGAEFLTESMVVNIAVDADLEGKTVQDQIASIAPYFNHELIHASRRLGLIKASEWNTLTDYVETTAVPKQFLDVINESRIAAGVDAIPDGSTYMEASKVIYAAEAIHKRDLDAADAAFERGEITESQLAAIKDDIAKRNWIRDDFVEEAVAMAMQNYSANAVNNLPKANAEAGETQVGVVKRILNFFRQMGTRIRNLGVTKPEDIFYTLSQGSELAERMQRGKALDVWYLRRAGGEEFNALREFAVRNQLEFPDTKSPDQIIEAQALAEGEETPDQRQSAGETDEEFAARWVADQRKSSPERRLAIDNVPRDVFAQQTTEVADRREAQAAADTQHDGLSEDEMNRLAVETDSSGRLLNNYLPGRLTWAVEYLGDLSHRLQQDFDREFTISLARTKIRDSFGGNLLDPDFDPEFEFNSIINIRAPFELRDYGDPDGYGKHFYDIKNKVEGRKYPGYGALDEAYSSELSEMKRIILDRYPQVLDRYTEAHRYTNKPVTRLGQLGKEVAILFGEGRYFQSIEKARELLRELDKYDAIYEQYGRDRAEEFRLQRATPGELSRTDNAFGDYFTDPGDVRSLESNQPDSGRSRPIVGIEFVSDELSNTEPFQRMEKVYGSGRYDVTIDPRRADYSDEPFTVSEVLSNPSAFRYRINYRPVSRDYLTEIPNSRTGSVFDSRLASLREDGKLSLNPESGFSNSVPFEVDDNYIYRGVSYEEMQSINETGQIKSLGDYNLSSQENLTLYTEDPATAGSYAGGFSVLENSPSADRPSYILKIKRPDEGLISSDLDSYVQDYELAVTSPVRSSEIVEISEVRPVAQSSGFEEISPSGFFGSDGFQSGSRSNPVGTYVFGDPRPYTGVNTDPGGVRSLEGKLSNFASYLDPVPSPVYDEKMSKGVKPGKFDSVAWGTSPLGRNLKKRQNTIITIPQGYSYYNQDLSSNVGMGAKNLDNSNPDIARYTQFTDWSDMLGTILPRLNSKTIKSGEFTLVNQAKDRSVLLWRDPERGTGMGTKFPIAITLDYVKDPANTETTGGSNDFWSVVGLQANGQFSIPWDNRTGVQPYYGQNATAETVLMAERPDLFPEISPREVKRYALNTSTAKLNAEQRAAVDLIYGNLPNPETNLYQRATSGIPIVNAETLTRIREKMIDHYTRVWSNQRMLESKQGARALADHGAHQAALKIDKASSFFAAMLEYGGIHFERPPNPQGLQEFDGTPVVKDLALVNDTDAVVGFDDDYNPIIRNVALEGKKRYTQETGGLMPILSIVASPGNKLVKEFFSYARAVRALRLRREGRTTDKEWPDAEIAQALSIAEAYPEIAVAYKNLQNWNNTLVDFLRETQVIPEWMADEWKKYGDYTPFYVDAANLATGNETYGSGDTLFLSLFGDEFGNEKTRFISTLQAGAVPERLKSGKGEEKLMEPIEAISKNSMSLLTSGLRNIARNRTIRDMRELGNATESNPGNGAVRVLVNGEPQYYKVDDLAMLNVLEGTFDGKNQALSTVSGILSKPANALRETVTRAPNFIHTNTQRDSMNAYQMGLDVKGSFLNIPVLTSFARYGKSLKYQYEGKSSPEYETLRKSGSVGGYELLGVNPKKMQRILDQATGDKSLVWKLWDATGEASARSESVVREQVYLQVLDKMRKQLAQNPELSPSEVERLAMSEAAHQAQEVINFSRRGGSELLRTWTSGQPFLNARIQGLDRIYRTLIGEGIDPTVAKRRLIQVITQRALMVGLTTTALEHFLFGDKEYEDIPEEIKQVTWQIPIPFTDLHYSVGIPYEAGLVSKVLPQQLYRAGRKLAEGATLGDASAEFGRSFDRAIVSTLGFDVVPQVLKPYQEVVSNYDSFRRGQIEPEWMRGMSPELRKRDSTGPASIWMSEASTYVPVVGGLSPLQIEHLVRGYFGTLGAAALTFANEIADEVVGSPQRAARNWYDYPFISSVIKGPSEGGLKQNFYDNSHRVVAGMVADINQLREEGRYEDIKELKRDKASVYKDQRKIKLVRKRLKALRDRLSRAQLSGRYSPEELREMSNKVKLREAEILMKAGFPKR